MRSWSSVKKVGSLVGLLDDCGNLVGSGTVDSVKFDAGGRFYLVGGWWFKPGKLVWS